MIAATAASPPATRLSIQNTSTIATSTMAPIAAALTPRQADTLAVLPQDRSALAVNAGMMLSAHDRYQQQGYIDAGQDRVIRRGRILMHERHVKCHVAGREQREHLQQR